MIEILNGKLFKVTIHTETLAYAGVTEVVDGFEHEVEPPREYGYCGLDDPPTPGEALVACERYTLVLADEDDLDDDGNLPLAEGLTGDDVTVEPAEWDYGDWDSDGTCWLVYVDEDTYAART